MQRRVNEGAEEAGRKPKEIRRVYNVDGAIGPDGAGLLEGSASRWAEELTRFVLDLGMDTFVYWPRVTPEDNER